MVATGYHHVFIATGYHSVAIATGYHHVAIATGYHQIHCYRLLNIAVATGYHNVVIATSYYDIVELHAFRISLLVAHHPKEASTCPIGEGTCYCLVIQHICRLRGQVRNSLKTVTTEQTERGVGSCYQQVAMHKATHKLQQQCKGESTFHSQRMAYIGLSWVNVCTEASPWLS